MKSNYKPWEIEASGYPSNQTIEEQLKYVVSYGSLSPSTFNAQPWKCRISNSSVDVFIDYQRLPTKSDKTGRFGYISLGCFIETLKIAGQYYGWQVGVEYTDEPKSGDLQKVAALSFKQSGEKQSSEDHLFQQITQRATNRSLHLDKLIPEDIKKTWQGAVIGEVKTKWLDQSAQQSLVELSKVADMAIWSDKEFRQEHVQWVRSNLTNQDDGMPGFGVGVKTLPSLLTKPIILSDKFAALQTAKNEKSLKNTSAYLVLTGLDSVNTWLDTGRSFQRLGLSATSEGLVLAPMGQFIEHDQTRQNLQELVGDTPQLFCRVGYASQPVRHSPRRSVDKIIIS